MMDRRVARSKRALRAALIELLRERNYDDFTLGDLLAVADVGRSTFYTHYTGKDDLLRQSLRMLHLEVREAMAATPRTGQPGGDLAFSAILLGHFHEHRDLSRHLKGRAAEIFLQEVTGLVGELIKESLEGLSPPEAADAELTIQFIRGAFIGMLTWWLEHPASRTSAEIDAAFQVLARRGLGGHGGFA